MGVAPNISKFWFWPFGELLRKERHVCWLQNLLWWLIRIIFSSLEQKQTDKGKILRLLGQEPTQRRVNINTFLFVYLKITYICPTCIHVMIVNGRSLNPWNSKSKVTWEKYLLNAINMLSVVGKNFKRLDFCKMATSLFRSNWRYVPGVL